MSLINLVVAAGNSFGDWRRRQRAYHELMALDDRSLADIGIHRSQIPALVEGMYQAAHTVSADAPAHGLRGARLATGHR